MSFKIYDPSGETISEQRTRIAPPSNLEGKKIMLFDIGKPRSDEFLNYLDEVLTHKGLTTLHARKPTNAKTAPQEVINYMAKEADVVIEALAD